MIPPGARKVGFGCQRETKLNVPLTSPLSEPFPEVIQDLL
jgi:hypothetical protein